METKSAYEDLYESTVNKIDSSARVHFNVRMGIGNVICEGVVIREGVEIGDNNWIGPYCILGDYAEKHGYFDKLGKVVIGNNNRFTKQVSIDSSTDGTTVVGNNVIILKNGHIGHEGHVDDGVIISCNAVVGGHSYIGKNSNLGLNSVVHQRIKVPENIILGMSSTITKKTILNPGRKYAGTPARDIGPNIRNKK